MRTCLQEQVQAEFPKLKVFDEHVIFRFQEHERRCSVSEAGSLRNAAARLSPYADAVFKLDESLHSCSRPGFQKDSDIDLICFRCVCVHVCLFTLMWDRGHPLARLNVRQKLVDMCKDAKIRAKGNMQVLRSLLIEACLHRMDKDSQKFTCI